MEDASDFRAVNCTDKLAVKSITSIDSSDFVDSTNSIRISNLSKFKNLAELTKLVERIGPSQKIYLKLYSEAGLWLTATDTNIYF